MRIVVGFWVLFFLFLVCFRFSPAGDSGFRVGCFDGSGFRLGSILGFASFRISGFALVEFWVSPGVDSGFRLVLDSGFRPRKFLGSPLTAGARSRWRFEMCRRVAVAVARSRG